MNFYKIYVVSLIFFLMSNNAGALVENANPVSIDSRIKTFVYSKNEIFPVILNYGYHSYIEFSKGESVKVLAMGDSVNWKVKSSENKLYIMPLEKNGQTNMLIETNKGRSYAFDLMCRTDEILQQASAVTKKKPASNLNMDYSAARDLAYIVRFYYPKTDEEFDLNDIKLPKISPPSQMHTTLEKPENLIKNNDTRYNYSYFAYNDSDDIVPVELFDDGRITYFKFPDNNKIIPKIFTPDRRGKELPSKMLSFNNYIIINGVYKNLSIRYKRKYVKITNKSL